MHMNVLHCNCKSPHIFFMSVAAHKRTQHALTRLIRYWNTRHKVFGDDYILPLTLYGM